VGDEFDGVVPPAVLEGAVVTVDGFGTLYALGEV